MIPPLNPGTAADVLNFEKIMITYNIGGIRK